jgi:hypothetical protein
LPFVVANIRAARKACRSLFTPIGNCKQACNSSLYFPYIMNIKRVHDLQLRSETASKLAFPHYAFSIFYANCTNSSISSSMVRKLVLQNCGSSRSISACFAASSTLITVVALSRALYFGTKASPSFLYFS